MSGSFLFGQPVRVALGMTWKNIVSWAPPTSRVGASVWGPGGCYPRSLSDSEYQLALKPSWPLVPSSSQIIPVKSDQEERPCPADLSPDPEGTAWTASCLFNGTGDMQFDSVIDAEFSEDFCTILEMAAAVSHHSEEGKPEPQYVLVLLLLQLLSSPWAGAKLIINFLHLAFCRGRGGGFLTVWGYSSDACSSPVWGTIPGLLCWWSCAASPTV